MKLTSLVNKNAFIYSIHCFVMYMIVFTITASSHQLSAFKDRR